MSQTRPTERLDYLDSARGIAALMVLFGHYINWKYPDYLGFKLASVIFNANDAVSFFFVLSGMVLTYPYLQYDRKLDIGKFYVSRIFRLYPGFWVALILCAIYAMRHELNVQGLTDLLILNKKKFWEEALLIRSVNNFYLPGFTLTIELLYSFFMPFMVVIARNNRKLLKWFLLASVIMAPATGGFLVHFTLGAIIGAYFQEIKSPEFKQLKVYRYRAIIIIAAILLFSIRQLTRISPLGETLMYLLDFLKLDFFFLTGIASFIFIICIIHFRSIQRILEYKIFIFYGRISYGIYLTHWVFVWAVGEYWESHILPAFHNNKTIAFLVTMLFVFISATIAATLVHYGVELPFMRMGKRITQKMKPTIEL
jgi:peptidoglycan/LPS O-acetylase OafA/YrhL